MKLKIINRIQYQRNGVHGRSFYHLMAELKEDGKTHNLIVTFEPTAGDKRALTHTVRAVDVDDIMKQWRGDEIGFKLNEIFADTFKGKDSYKTIGDLIY